MGPWARRTHSGRGTDLWPMGDFGVNLHGIRAQLKFDEVGAPTRVESKKESARCREPFILLRLCRLDFALKAPSTMAR